MLFRSMAGTPILYARVDLGVVSFEATRSWRFFPMEGRVVGRPTNGVGVMPAYGSLLSAEEIEAVAYFVSEVAGRSE